MFSRLPSELFLHILRYIDNLGSKYTSPCKPQRLRLVTHDGCLGRIRKFAKLFIEIYCCQVVYFTQRQSIYEAAHIMEVGPTWAKFTALFLRSTITIKWDSLDTSMQMPSLHLHTFMVLESHLA